MKATIWARGFTLPTGFCYNCSALSSTSIAVYSQGGIASAIGPWHGPVVAALAAAASSGAPHQVTYCKRCAASANKKAPEPLPPTVGLILLVLGFGVITSLTTGSERIVSLSVACAAVAGLIAWLRYIRRQPEPGQTTRWRAFAVLNEGKDLFTSNREFVRIEYTNPRILEEILRLNPGVEVTLD